MKIYYMKNKYKKIYLVFGIMIFLMGIAAMINNDIFNSIKIGDNLINVFLTLLIFVMGVLIILKSFKCRVEIGNGKIINHNGILPGKSVNITDVGFVYKEHNNQFVIYKKNGKKMTINYIFDNISYFNKELKKNNLFVTSDLNREKEKF